MPDELKLWQRLLREDYSSYIAERTNLDSVDPTKPALICLPGVSTTHESPRAINGYMGVAEKILGGREASERVQIFSVSYRETEHELSNIERSNDDPRSYFSAGAQAFAEKVMAPLLEKGMDVNIYAKSHGPVFFRMALNALHAAGIKPQPHQIRMVATGNTARLDTDMPDQATVVYIEGTNDIRADKLNHYKTATPSNHNKLTITPISPHTLHVLTDVPEKVRFWDMRPNTLELKEADDPERHTTQLYSARSPATIEHVEVLERAARNMVILPGEAFSIESALEPCPPLIPLRYDSAPTTLTTSIFIAEAWERGKQNQEITALLLDWDRTMVDSDATNLHALNATFAQMSAKGFSVEGVEQWDIADMRQQFFPTSPEFFNRVYGHFGQDCVSEAIDTFNEERAAARDRTTLMPGAEALLQMASNLKLPVAIVSNKEEQELLLQVAELLPKPFNTLRAFGNIEGQPAKPSPEPIYRAMKELGIPKDRAPSVVYVGDQVRSDVAAAVAAGCKTYLVGNDNKDELLSEAKHVLHSGNPHLRVQMRTGHEVQHFKDLASLARHLGETPAPKRAR